MSESPAGPPFSSTVSLSNEEIAVRVRGGVKVVVPASIKEITTYVLLEQEDWFEAEIGFIRNLTMRGMTAIDIGANYGVYSLALAIGAGAKGHVFAFEPASDTAAFLRKSVALNHLPWITVVQAALSDRIGEAVLVGQQAETKALQPGLPVGTGEAVVVTTLDAWAAPKRLPDVDFVKIDAEGAEASIIAGGQDFFRRYDPLIMIEIKHGNDFDLNAVCVLRQLDYTPYRLVPGLGLLAPISDDILAGGRGTFDPYQLNLFCCKKTRAAELHDRGLLASDDVPAPVLSSAGAGLSWLRQQRFFLSFAQLADRFATNSSATNVYCSALDHYALACDIALDANARLEHLKAARNALIEATARDRSIGRLCALARIEAEFGFRRNALDRVAEIAQILSRSGASFEEPFLPPLRRFDKIAPGENLSNWLIAAVFELGESLASFSSIFSRGDMLDELQFIVGTPFASPSLERRRQLLRLRLGLQTRIEPAPLLAVVSDDHLNPELWSLAGPQPWISSR
ncbi:MAG: FkbM family methyltransferase [Rhodospirillales bacterium]|nr:FkbM family methyltransferase [Rhodospirillales bacterium]